MIKTMQKGSPAYLHHSQTLTGRAMRSKLLSDTSVMRASATKWTPLAQRTCSCCAHQNNRKAQGRVGASTLRFLAAEWAWVLGRVVRQPGSWGL